MPAYWRVERWGPRLETAREQIRVSGGAASRKPLGDSSAGLVRPDMLRLQRPFLADQTSLVPRLVVSTGGGLFDHHQHLRCRPRLPQRRIALDRLGNLTGKDAIAVV